jgi:hypothetical protein
MFLINAKHGEFKESGVFHTIWKKDFYDPRSSGIGDTEGRQTNHEVWK